MSSPLLIYVEMSALSSQMVEAARASDWDRLTLLEEKVAALRNSLATVEDAAALGEADREQIAQLIRRILDDNAEIRQHVEPWMEHVRHLLGDATSRHRIAHAYGLE